MVKVYGNQLKVKNYECVSSFIYICILVSWNDLILLKPDGIEESIQSASISLALFGSKPVDQSELKEDDLMVDFTETSSGNLNITWKLKQILGITVTRDLLVIINHRICICLFRSFWVRLFC